MYSGFMALLLSNNTNSTWEVFSVGKSYGIFNQNGEANIYGITKKDITRGSSIYNFVDEKFSNRVLEKIENKTCYGFLTNSQLQLMDEMFGLYVYYTHSYAIANPSENSTNPISISDDVENESYRDNVYQTIYFVFKKSEVLEELLDWIGVFNEMPNEIVGLDKINRMEADWIGYDEEVDTLMDNLMNKIFK